MICARCELAQSLGIDRVLAILNHHRWRALASGAIAVVISLAAAPRLWAERSSNWRMFKTSDGLHDSYAASVSVSPRGNIWVKHGDADAISVFNGYKVQTMPSPGRDAYRIYESRTGQLWSLYASGLVVYTGEQWAYHPIAEIRDEIQSDPLRQLRQVPLLPAEQGRVLFLLSDRLMEYDAGTRRALTVKSVAETHLDRFLEMAESRDGGVWVTGIRGIGKLPGPMKHLRAGAEFQEFLTDETTHAENLQRPFEDAAGVVTVSATDARANGQRLVLQLAAGKWTVRPVEMANIRQAWSAWDGVCWAYTVNSLWRFDPLPGTSARERIWAGQYKDVAIETNDVFWLATSEGLLRYAPNLWRTPVELEDINSHVHAIAQDTKDRIWFATSEALLSFQTGRTKAVKWPEGLEGSFEANDSLYALPDGHMAVGAGARSFLFDPQTDQFQILDHPSGRRVRLLGQSSDGVVIGQLQAAEGTANSGFELAKYDGASFEPFLTSPASWSYGADILFVTLLSNGDVWVGAHGGLGRFRNGTLEQFGLAEGFTDTRASFVAEVGGGKLWCGGVDRIFELNGRSWSVVRGGFDRISAVVKGFDDRLWIATAAGLFSFANGSWVQYGVEEGLASQGVSKVFVSAPGQLWAGTTRGVSRYHPDADLAPPKTLPPLLEDPNGDVSGERTTILLNGYDKWLNTPGDRLLYTTRLDDGLWSPYTNSIIKTFERLGAGKHRVDVRTMDRNRNEDPDFASLEFTVVLPWSKDPRLIGSVLSAAVLVIFFAGLAVNRHLRLIRSYAEVERIVSVRTRELERANEELVQSQKMKALGALAAGIAHDFNNILSIIKGSAQIIQNNLDDKRKILTRLSRIQAVVEQGSGVVRSILGLSRVKEKDFLRADLNGVVDDALKLVGDRFLADTTVQFLPEPSLPSVWIVPELVQQMLLNLILNAADAMDHRGQIVLSTGELLHLPPDLALAPGRAAEYLFVSVRDTGCGISPEILPRIFEPFFTTKALSVRRGTGLGLSIVYELARQMDCGLEVRSAVGRGSTFRIIVPVRERLAGANNPLAEASGEAL